MLRNTFIFIPGVGELTERRLWQSGITTWDELKESSQQIPHSRVTRSALEKHINNAEAALERGDVRYFADRLDQSHYWRLINEFSNEICYLDIETTGLSWYYDRVTTISTFDGKTPHLFVKDHNLRDVVEQVNSHEILVTFNGKRFDRRFLEERFPEFSEPPVHLDLRYLGRSVDLTGQLKQIEKDLDIERPESVQDFEGRQAPVLWRQFLRGEDESFRRLAVYNIYDTVNLAKLLGEIYKRKLDGLATELEKEPLQKTLDQIEQNEFEPIYQNLFDTEGLVKELPEIAVHAQSSGLHVEVGGRNQVVVDRTAIDQSTQNIHSLEEAIQERNGPAVSVGIDLSGSADSPTGICVLDGTRATMDVVSSDEEILDYVFEADPTVVSIDSPLTLPEGRCCVDDSCDCSENGIMRECERILKERGVNVYPCLIDSMKSLTARGRDLSQQIEERGCETIESFPGAAQDVLNIPRKQVSLTELEQGLRATGISIAEKDRKISNDELDALTSALVGHFYLAGKYEHVGRSSSSGIIIPDLTQKQQAKDSRN